MAEPKKKVSQNPKRASFYADDYTNFVQTPSLQGKISIDKRDSTTKWPPRNQDLFNVNVASSSRGFLQ